MPVLGGHQDFRIDATLVFVVHLGLAFFDCVLLLPFSCLSVRWVSEQGHSWQQDLCPFPSSLG